MMPRIEISCSRQWGSPSTKIVVVDLLSMKGVPLKIPKSC